MGDPDPMAEGQKEGKMEESEASLTHNFQNLPLPTLITVAFNIEQCCRG